MGKGYYEVPYCHIVVHCPATRNKISVLPRGWSSGSGWGLDKEQVVFWGTVEKADKSPPKLGKGDATLKRKRNREKSVWLIKFVWHCAGKESSLGLLTAVCKHKYAYICEDEKFKSNWLDWFASGHSKASQHLDVHLETSTKSFLCMGDFSFGHQSRSGRSTQQQIFFLILIQIITYPIGQVSL